MFSAGTCQLGTSKSIGYQFRVAVTCCTWST